MGASLSHIDLDADVKLSSVIAIDATKTALGPWAGLTTALLVAVSLLGTANAIILYGARYLVLASHSLPWCMVIVSIIA